VPLEFISLRLVHDAWFWRPISGRIRIRCLNKLMTFSSSLYPPQGLNQFLAPFAESCARNCILINMTKTIILIFGPFRLPLPEFRLCQRFKWRRNMLAFISAQIYEICSQTII
jgi:hypothetical protein